MAYNLSSDFWRKICQLHLMLHISYLASNIYNMSTSLFPRSLYRENDISPQWRSILSGISALYILINSYSFCSLFVCHYLLDLMLFIKEIWVANKGACDLLRFSSKSFVGTFSGPVLQALAYSRLLSDAKIFC